MIRVRNSDPAWPVVNRKSEYDEQIFFFLQISLDMCGFESSLCGFENDVSHLGHWGRKRGTEHHVDHTYGTENGEWKTVVASSTLRMKD